MAVFKPFKAFRPAQSVQDKIPALPYDVMNSDEAREAVKGNELSFLHVDKAEIDLDKNIDIYDDAVYQKAKENLEKLENEHFLCQDETPCFYIYRQKMGERTQTGLVGCASIDDYINNNIKKHELTRRDKEEDRMKHVRVNNANIEPVFFAYPDNSVLNDLINRYAATKAEYDFVAPIDGFRHQFWVISDAADIKTVTEEFAKMPALYIADGHHRSAAAALVGAEKQKQNPNHKGTEEYNYFMAVCFQASQLTILDYNRVVKDLNGMTTDEFLEALSKNFVVEKKGEAEYKPQELHEFSLYIDKKWYSLKAKEGTYDNSDPIGVLDVDISSRLILDELMGITDLRSSNRIDFVGGLRGLQELKRRVDNGEMRWALALYPVSMKQIMDIADSGKIMPPKATWFEPKLRSGIVIHKLD